MGVIVAILIIFAFTIYFKQRQKIIQTSKILNDQIMIHNIIIEKNKLRIKRKITLRIGSDIIEPLTFGFINPILLLPNTKFSKDQEQFIIEHELLHIKNCDALFKIIGIIVIALNWYNPLVYLLFNELNSINENVCDEFIALNCEKNQKMEYANLILDMVTEKPKDKFYYVSSFSSNKMRVEERILSMLNVKKQKLIIKILAGCILVIIGFSSTLTVFAYDKPAIVAVNNIDEIPTNSSNEKTETIFIEESLNEIDSKNSSIYFESGVVDTHLPNGEFFQDEVGNIYEIETQTIQRGCSHEFVSGSYRKHNVSGSSCQNYIYSAQRCTKCGYVEVGEFLNQINYKKCPH